MMTLSRFGQKSKHMNPESLATAFSKSTYDDEDHLPLTTDIRDEYPPLFS